MWLQESIIRNRGVMAIASLIYTQGLTQPYLHPQRSRQACTTPSQPEMYTALHIMLNSAAFQLAFGRPTQKCIRTSDKLKSQSLMLIRYVGGYRSLFGLERWTCYYAEQPEVMEIKLHEKDET